METKKWYRSRTLWTNALMLIGIAVLKFSGQDMIDAEVQASVIVFANVVLRVITNTGLTAK
jgi:hypothetical protein